MWTILVVFTMFKRFLVNNIEILGVVAFWLRTINMDQCVACVQVISLSFSPALSPLTAYRFLR